jgi:hypothetical protein
MDSSFLSDLKDNKIYVNRSIPIFKNWNTFESTVLSDKGPLTVKWNDVQKLAAAWLIQTGGGGSGVYNLNNFFNNFTALHNRMWQLNYNFGIYDLPDNPIIADVGAGTASMDMFAHQYLPESKFYLIDKKDWDISDIDSIVPLNNFCWKQDWGVVEDAIKNSHYDRNNFVFLSETEDWNFEADLITSYMAWGMHFHKSSYWEQCLKSLKIGGKLVLDINSNWLDSFTEQIDEELGFNHVIMFSYSDKMISLNQEDHRKALQTHYPNYKLDLKKRNPNLIASRCMWIRQR